jgi:hypothetical protein
VRRAAFFLWAALLSLLLGVTFAGVAVALLGGASLVWPDLPGALGRVGGAAAAVWAVAFVVATEWGNDDRTHPGRSGFLPTRAPPRRTKIGVSREVE